MGVVQGSTNWNGQDNFQDFIQFHAARLCMTREEYMAHYGSANAGINEAKPGPDPYHRGLEDDEVEDKEDQIKKQAKMDDDDPDAYEEMPGDEEAREKGEVKTSDATKAYNKLYKENKHVKSMNEMAMGYDGHTGLFYIKGVPFTEERLEQVLKHLRTKVKLGDLPKQFSYFPAIQVADEGSGEIVTITLDKAKEIEATLKRFKGKLAHDGDFNEAVNPIHEADDTEQKSTDRGPLDDDAMETGLKKKAEESGVPIGIIRAVMRRGLAAWKSGHRPGANQQQWGYARVNAFLTKGEGTWGKADKDLAKEVRDGGHDKKLKKA